MLIIVNRIQFLYYSSYYIILNGSFVSSAKLSIKNLFIKKLHFHPILTFSSLLQKIRLLRQHNKTKKYHAASRHTIGKKY